MIWNIADHRTRPYRWKRINAIVEAIWHDNSREDSDQAGEVPEEIVYDKREGISLADAIAWASGLPDRVTLYLFDEGRHDCSRRRSPPA
jgi:hypothetical protein